MICSDYTYIFRVSYDYFQKLQKIEYLVLNKGSQLFFLSFITCSITSENNIMMKNQYQCRK